MADSNPTVVITGVAGNLGLRLLPQLTEFEVIGVDIQHPKTNLPLRFVQMDLGQEESCRELFLLLRESGATAVIHLAFVLDPVGTGVLDLDRMWHINVAGTARVMEAITEANRRDAVVSKFIFPSSVSVYGPGLPNPVGEEYPLGAHTLPYAIRCEDAVRICCVPIFLPGPRWTITWSEPFAAHPMEDPTAQLKCDRMASGFLACCLWENPIWKSEYNSCTSTMWRA
jgi:nucleoside-diphosphate-sugar epimerase